VPVAKTQFRIRNHFRSNCGKSFLNATLELIFCSDRVPVYNIFNVAQRKKAMRGAAQASVVDHHNSSTHEDTVDSKFLDLSTEVWWCAVVVKAAVSTKKKWNKMN
jgi:hypothetical protein